MKNAKKSLLTPSLVHHVSKATRKGLKEAKTQKIG